MGTYARYRYLLVAVMPVVVCGYAIKHRTAMLQNHAEFRFWFYLGCTLMLWGLFGFAVLRRRNVTGLLACDKDFGYFQRAFMTAMVVLLVALSG